MVGRAVPGWAISALGAVAGIAGALVAVGASGWLVVAVVLAAAAAVFPRGPFAVLLVVQLAVAGADDARAWQVATVVGTTHLVLAVSFLAAWVPRAARVQLRALRRPALRFLAVDAFAQAVAVGVMAVRSGSAGAVGVEVAMAGGVALLVLAGWLLVPTLRSSSSSSSPDR
jgi:hypothetical protein